MELSAGDYTIKERGYIMSYNDDRYYKEKGGDYYSDKEANRAFENGHLERLSNGNYYDRETGEEYWSDGTKRN